MRDISQVHPLHMSFHLRQSIQCHLPLFSSTSTFRPYSFHTSRHGHSSIPLSFLFRVYSDESTGVNNPTVFKPHIYTSGSTIDIKDVINDTSKLAECLAKTLQWKDENDDTPFINWTDSFLLAIVYALYKLHPKPDDGKRSAEHNIHIICIKTATAVDDAGQPTVFTKSSELMRRYEVHLKQPYDNEYATIGSVWPRKGSFVLSLDKILKAGLYQLHPALRAAFHRSSPRWRLTTIDFRNFWHATQACLTIEHIHLAAHLTSLAVPVGRNKAYPLPFLAAFLAMQKRPRADGCLESWMAQFEAADLVCVSDGRYRGPQQITNVDMNQFYVLLDILVNKNIIETVYVPSPDATLLGTSEEAAEWLAFQHARKVKRRQDLQAMDNDKSRQQGRRASGHGPGGIWDWLEGQNTEAEQRAEYKQRRARLHKRHQRRQDRLTKREHR
ncbi:hypothetical protein AMS68_006576 [Peltaster fructicola]|uniref:DUF7587 domain-containing protein n=1 Tax=Peltaster fructicola TaxID=286661 RepID=A0A6H0Y2H6_9PEZI|nr:hypothetical protein AMS68_006576 [Peltaster fructicola]